MNQRLNFESLKKNLIDVIKESQIKLGYAKTSLGLYYPIESLNSLLNSDLDEASMERTLQNFSIYVEEELGNIIVSRDNTRFCIKIPDKGVEYVHYKVEATDFLRAFIKKIEHCNLKLDDILEVFYQYSNHVICKKMNTKEFDYLLYFEDGIPDDFRYCIKFEGNCVIYHRFTPKDYEVNF